MKHLAVFLFAAALPVTVFSAALTALPDVTVIDGRGGNSVPHATLILEGSKVREIRTSANAYKPDARCSSVAL